MYRTAVLSKVPGRVIGLPSRFTAVLFEFGCGSALRKVIMTSLYSIASDQEQGAALAEDIISALQVFGLEWMVLGDYNVTTSETGWHHGWHRGCHGPLTRPSQLSSLFRGQLGEGGGSTLG